MTVNQLQPLPPTTRFVTRKLLAVVTPVVRFVILVCSASTVTLSALSVISVAVWVIRLLSTLSAFVRSVTSDVMEVALTVIRDSAVVIRWPWLFTSLLNALICVPWDVIFTEDSATI